MVRDTALSQHKKSPLKKPRLSSKLILLTGLLNAAFIGLFWLVILIAEDQMEVISLHHWLDSEASMYERDYQQTGSRQSLPNHYEFDIYWSDSEMPLWLKNYTTPGFYEHHVGTEDKHFLVRQDPSGKGLFYVVFKDDADDYLDEYETRLQLFTLILGFAIILLMFLYTLYLVRQILLPLNRVQAKIKQMPPDQPDFRVDAKYQELALIEQALLNSKTSIARFFRREQEFSRFAAHEIRTPLMVLQGSSDIINRLEQDKPQAQKAAQRISKACEDISLLTDTFLLLGKEHIEQHHFSLIDIGPLLVQQLETITALFSAEQPAYRILKLESGTVQTPPSFIYVVLNNLLKNAFSYAEGEVLIELDEQCLSVANNYQTAQRQNRGYGYGLIIIERICDKMHWSFTVNDHDGLFEVSVRFL